MLFNSYLFVLLFLPLSLAGYYLLNCVHQYLWAKIFLIGMSLWFYGYFNPSYLPIIVLSVTFNFFIHCALHRCERKAARLSLLYLALCANLGVLFYYKYNDFFISNVNALFHMDFQLKNLLLPLGISFFTFQQLSFVIDSYKDRALRYPLWDYALFVTYFPQLIAGPIVTHDEIIPQFADTHKKHIDFGNLSKGIMAFAFGLAKKVLIADTFGNAVNWGYENVNLLDTTNALFIMFAYTIQIYFDFSGYCDMATGVGKMFNIEIPINFNSPYRALTVPEFWKRWHITLTRFFTRYLYIPLGGNRKGNVRTYLNIFIVFLVSGLWHGANWTFILWGVLHGIANIVSRLFAKRIERVHPALNWLVTFTFVNLTWIYFRASSIAQAHQVFKSIARLQFGPLHPDIAVCFGISKNNAFIFPLLAQALKEWRPGFPDFTVLLICLFALFAVLGMKNTNERIRTFRPTAAAGTVVVLLLVCSVISFAGVSTFLYFNF